MGTPYQNRELRIAETMFPPCRAVVAASAPDGES